MIQFMKKNQRHILWMSLILSILCMGIILIKGLNLGLEFVGGIEIELTTTQSYQSENIKGALKMPVAIVVPFGSDKQFLIKIPHHVSIDETLLKDNLLKNLKGEEIKAEITRMDVVGSEFSASIYDQAITAIVFALVAMTLYIAIRFEWRLGLSAILALMHDPLIVLGLFALFQWTFDLPALAGLLAVIGYSINDTIVVFDRVRENFQRSDDSSEDIFFNSIHQTLGRTMITSLLTFMVVLSLLIFGTEVLRGFSLALAIGIISGTYSSIAVAGPLSLLFGVKKEHLFPPVEVDEEVSY